MAAQSICVGRQFAAITRCRRPRTNAVVNCVECIVEETDETAVQHGTTQSQQHHHCKHQTATAAAAAAAIIAKHHRYHYVTAVD